MCNQVFHTIAIVDFILKQTYDGMCSGPFPGKWGKKHVTEIRIVQANKENGARCVEIFLKNNKIGGSGSLK